MSRNGISYWLLAVVFLYNLSISWPFFSYNFSKHTPVVENDEFYNFLGDLPGANGKKSFKTIFQIDFLIFDLMPVVPVKNELRKLYARHLTSFIKVSTFYNYLHTGISPPTAS
ncbi:MAG: hypothetical protein A2381_15895 [Bdellovibrionales bacterium RIFOXYB1_FULL_37_110]|nr:MAG: hypothetical protein A2417_07745 [Bdellovibrionales bacterium RIFOXYC1_FULL_37_79]OFZ57096.1 MAG: hypothetical protein A2381_15895 [Bdellovibrionales bacterium RIFOXYB1_FULL_37_110]OFZ63034.1 MAG: hypothetical protein A2577_19745 [Bdellovibrionales bacterium RIFOXYD1_FULL_36_51]